MNKIVINDLYSTELETFIDDLEIMEVSIILGGMFWGLYPSSTLNPGIYINTIYDGINNISKTYEGAGNFHDNKINTVDYSRTANIKIYR